MQCGVWILECSKISSICCINGSQTKLNIVSLVQNYFTAQEILISVSSDMSASGQPLATSYSEESWKVKGVGSWCTFVVAGLFHFLSLIEVPIVRFRGPGLGPELDYVSIRHLGVGFPMWIKKWNQHCGNHASPVFFFLMLCGPFSICMFTWNGCPFPSSRCRSCHC